MGFTLKSFDVLKDEFERGVKELMEYHKVKEEENLPTERQREIQFLRASINKLNSSSVTDLDKSGKDPHIKAKTLTGLAYLFREMISDTYYIRSPDNSKFQRILTGIIGTNEENVLEEEDVFSLTSAAMKFVSDQIFTNVHSKKVMLENTIYSDINGYGVSTPKKLDNLNVLWKKGNAILSAERNLIFDNSVDILIKEVKQRKEEEENQKKKEEAAKTGGHGSSFWNFGRRSDHTSKGTTENDENKVTPTH
ncbi:hypothetical protein E3983_04585 [Legionella israelensis]|uniref:Dot/Icm T4SS effector n=1 Tax=Legionella israelensis TaxID=454 RepID=A0AAX1EF57_9GAMM|nr:hypothetical protein [Legionella israelensis]QBR83693.1 hypothetical protein E3983_04585 [Legionella israelensis]